MLSIGASSGGQVSRQINVAFQLSHFILRVRCNACGKGFRDGCESDNNHRGELFHSKQTQISSAGKCADKDNIINVKDLDLHGLSHSIEGDQKKTNVVRLKTFYTLNASRKKS